LSTRKPSSQPQYHLAMMPPRADSAAQQIREA
jgi:hypothetical protein